MFLRIALSGGRLVDGYRNIMGKSGQWLQSPDATIAPTELLEYFAPHLNFIFTELHHQIIKNNPPTAEFIAEYISKLASMHPLPPAVLSKLHSFFLYIAKQSSTLKESQNHGPISDVMNRCYSVFHGGEYHFYYGIVPNDVLDLKKTTLFWMDMEKKEYQSLAQPILEKFYLEPKIRDLLIYLCSNTIREKTISLEDIFRNIWPDSPTANLSKMRGTFSVATNKLNAFAFEKFISEDSDKYVQRIRGQDKFRISGRCADAICIIN